MPRGAYSHVSVDLDLPEHGVVERIKCFFDVVEKECQKGEIIRKNTRLRLMLAPTASMLSSAEKRTSNVSSLKKKHNTLSHRGMYYEFLERLFRCVKRYELRVEILFVGRRSDFVEFLMIMNQVLESLCQNEEEAIREIVKRLTVMYSLSSRSIPLHSFFVVGEVLCMLLVPSDVEKVPDSIIIFDEREVVKSIRIHCDSPTSIVYPTVSNIYQEFFDNLVRIYRAGRFLYLKFDENTTIEEFFGKLWKFFDVFVEQENLKLLQLFDELFRYSAFLFLKSRRLMEREASKFISYTIRPVLSKFLSDAHARLARPIDTIIHRNYTFFANHDSRHAESVLLNAIIKVLNGFSCWLNKNYYLQLNEIERFIILMACILHDIGLGVGTREFTALWEKTEGETRSQENLEIREERRKSDELKLISDTIELIIGFLEDYIRNIVENAEDIERAKKYIAYMFNLRGRELFSISCMKDEHLRELLEKVGISECVEKAPEIITKLDKSENFDELHEAVNNLLRILRQLIQKSMEQMRSYTERTDKESEGILVREFLRRNHNFFSLAIIRKKLREHCPLELRRFWYNIENIINEVGLIAMAHRDLVIPFLHISPQNGDRDKNGGDRRICSITLRINTLSILKDRTYVEVPSSVFWPKTLDDPDLLRFPIREYLLGLVIRLADAVDIECRKRARPDYAWVLQVIEKDETQIEHWAYKMLISDVMITTKGGYGVIEIHFQTPLGLKDDEDKLLELLLATEVRRVLGDMLSIKRSFHERQRLTGSMEVAEILRRIISIDRILLIKKVSDSRKVIAKEVEINQDEIKKLKDEYKKVEDDVKRYGKLIMEALKDYYA